MVDPTLADAYIYIILSLTPLPPHLVPLENGFVMPRTRAALRICPPQSSFDTRSWCQDSAQKDTTSAHPWHAAHDVPRPVTGGALANTPRTIGDRRSAALGSASAVGMQEPAARSARVGLHSISAVEVLWNRLRSTAAVRPFARGASARLYLMSPNCATTLSAMRIPPKSQTKSPMKNVPPGKRKAVTTPKA